MENVLNQPSNLDSLIAEIAEELKPTVQAIEKGIKTTQNNYGRYMAILGQVENLEARKVYALGLMKAGANKQGVKSALQVLNS